MLRVRRGKLPLLALAVGATLPTLGFAQTANWTYNAGGNVSWTQSWNVNTNWNPNTAFPNSTTAVVNLTADRLAGGSGTIILNAAPITIGRIAVAPVGVAGPTLGNSYTLTGSGSLTIVNGGTIDVTSSGTASLGVTTFNTRIQTPANSNITKIGTGAVVLSGTNSFGSGSGVNGLTVAGGTVVATSAGALGGLSIVATSNDGVLELQNQTVGTNPSPVLAGIGATVAPANGSIYASVGNNTWNGNVFLLQNASIGAASGATLTVNGNVFTDGAGTVGNGLTKVGAGMLNVNSLALNGPVAANGGTLKLKVSGTPGSASKVGGLSIAGGAIPTASLDITNNAVIVQTANLTSALATHASANAAALYASNGLAWDLPGLTSSTVANDINVLGTPTGVGILLNNDGGGSALFYGDGNDLPLFQGQSVNENSLLLKYTYLGDSDLSGVVDTVDFSLFQAGFGNAVPYTSWGFGDYDYNGVVDTVDFALFQAGYSFAGPQLGDPLAAQIVSFALTNGLPVSPSVSALVPEPASIGLISLGMLGLARRRRNLKAS